MNRTAQLLLVAAVSGALVPALCAQSTSNTSQQQQSQSSQSKPSPDQYSGVSNPPPNSTIVANEPYSDDTLPARTPPAKPSPDIPLPPPPASAPAAVPAASPAPPSSSAGNPNRYDNTDFGIVTSVPSQDQAPSQSDPSLHKRAWNPNDHIVNYVPVNPNQLGVGTNIRVHLTQDLSSDTAIPGNIFRATVASNVYNGAVLIIPAGSELRGRIAHVAQGHHLGLHARIRLLPEVVILPDGTAYHLDASLLQANVPGTRTTDEGTIVATVRLTKDAVTYGAGAGTGAVVGAVVAGPVGAGVGSLVGAGLATTHLLMQDPTAVNLPKGATLIFSLTEPMLLVPTKN